MAFAFISDSCVYNNFDDSDWKAKRREQDRRTLSDLVNQERQRRLDESLELWRKLSEQK